MKTNQLSEHFTLKELTHSATALRLGILNAPSPQAVENLEALCRDVLEPLRAAWGAPIVVSSGYRGCVLNRKVGGAPGSDHIYGCAADIHTLSNRACDNRRLFSLALWLMRQGKISNVKQLIDEHHFCWIHISRQDGRTLKRNQVLHLPLY